MYNIRGVCSEIANGAPRKNENTPFGRTDLLFGQVGM